jgi:hypothetical protein
MKSAARATELGPVALDCRIPLFQIRVSKRRQACRVGLFYNGRAGLQETVAKALTIRNLFLWH